MKKVSIVLPVYNGEKYLAQSIESVLNQTYKNIELIIVNDNSFDNSLSIAQSYAQKDSRIKIITNETNQKLPESLNIGFREAEGEYYSWTSDDNFYSDEAIETMVKYLDENSDDVMVCCDFNKLDEGTKENDIYRLKVSPQVMINGNCIGACFLYKKSAAKEIGEYKKEKFLVEDYDYWLRMMLRGNIGHIDKSLYTYRMHSKSLSGTRMKEIIEKTVQIQKEYLPLYQEKFENITLNLPESMPTRKKKTFLQRIFSIEKNSNKKILYFFGFKLSTKSKQ